MGNFYENISELKEFVSQHNLMNKNSIIQFTAKVTIITVQNRIDFEEMRVGITFEDDGKITILESHIDPYLYPTVFYAQWQKIEHVEGVFLRITDTHLKNPSIGKYEVKIVPLKRLRD